MQFSFQKLLRKHTCLSSVILIVKIKVVKNKVASPFREAEVDILYGKGFSRDGEIIDFGVKFGLIEKSGSWFSYKGEKLGQGKENVKIFLEKNKEIANNLFNQIKWII